MLVVMKTRKETRQKEETNHYQGMATNSQRSILYHRRRTNPAHEQPIPGNELDLDGKDGY